MRPIELVAEGFGPFRDRVTIDFTDADFFALVGPTGAGKSSVIDAICFALYGIVPRYDDRRLVAPALTTGVAQARVSFTFGAGGQRYTATRVVRRTARGATTKECRLERLGESIEVLAGDPDATSKQVGAILGLTPEHFTRAVVLPQGEFAKFLHDKPADRQKLLVELLGLDVYGRMASAARARGATAKASADALDGQLADLAGATAQAQRDAAARVADLADLRSQVTAAAGTVATLGAAMAAAEVVLAAQRGLQVSLRAVVVPEHVRQRAQQLAAAQEAMSRAQEAAEIRHSGARAVEAVAAAAPDVAGLAESLARRQRLAEESAALPQARAALADARAAAERAQAALADLEAEVRAADDAVRALERTHAAHDLASTLVAGQECPVCLAPVTAIPDRSAPPDLAAARESSSALRAQLPRLAAAERRAAADHQAALTTHDLLVRTCQALEAQLVGVPAAAELTEELAAVRAVQARAAQARTLATEAQQDLDRAAQVVRAVAAQLQLAAAQYTAQRDAVATLGPPAPTGELAADWGGLALWSAAREVEVAATIAVAEADRLAHEESLSSLVAGLAARCEVLGVLASRGGRLGSPTGGPRGSDFADIAPAVAGEHARAEAALEAIRADRARAADLRAQQGELVTRAQVASTLGQLLSARGFESWVLAEALSELVAGASVTLRELSGGAYSLAITETGDFLVIDHREADATRPARTLSGGETFQASLALALALADHLGQFAPGGATALESIFLDEGFGTLDEDSLEVVAATLETLAGGNRVVGLVTHVKELAARVPVRFEVRKSGRTAVVERITS